MRFPQWLLFAVLIFVSVFGAGVALRQYDAHQSRVKLLELSRQEQARAVRECKDMVTKVDTERLPEDPTYQDIHRTCDPVLSGK